MSYDPRDPAAASSFFDRWRQDRERETTPPRARHEEQHAPTAPSIHFTQASTGNDLRPTTFEDIIGQEDVKSVMRRLVDSALAQGRPLDHCLLVGPSGTGKSTFAFVIAKALGKNLVQLEAPISHDTLVQLQGIMKDGDILFIDEIHGQALAERRGKTAATTPEVLFAVMEDRRLPTATGVLPYPAITVMGATTDEGLLPDAFVNRFPIRPSLDAYKLDELVTIAEFSADALDVEITYEAALKLAKASRGIPREINSYVRNARSLSQDGWVRPDLVDEVLRFINVTHDGLTRDMQATLLFMYQKCRYIRPNSEVIYKASVDSIATAIGKSRDSKAIKLRVEPYLIAQGYLQVLPGGRRLTDLGILRAIGLESE